MALPREYSRVGKDHWNRECLLRNDYHEVQWNISWVREDGDSEAEKEQWKVEA